MSPEGSIAAHRIWKRFRADRRRMLLRDELERLRARIAGDPSTGWRWALRDVSLEIAPGESVALVGVNGSGKSTLLKILTKVMYPTAGRISVTGRVGALIEVRAGIHPDLSGRENVYLYGSLLGLRRRDVAARFDDIVEFAELETAIDRQLKFYSTGMQMRLGFAIAAYLEPDVLLVDEVLAVGDASFQQRCLGRMREVLAQGTTLVFVSHDLAAVEAMCTRGVWLHDGIARADATIADVLEHYRGFIEESAHSPTTLSGVLRLLKLAVVPEQDQPRTGEPLAIRVSLASDTLCSGVLAVGVSEGPGAPIFVLQHDVIVPAGEREFRCRIESLPLPRGRFFMWVGVFDRRGHHLLPWQPASQFDVLGPELPPPPVAVARLAPVHVAARWEAC